MAPTNSSMLTISCQPHYRQWWRWEDFPLCEVGRHSQRPLWISSPIWMFGEDLGCPWERRKCWQLDSRSNEDPKPSWINSLHLTFLGVLHQCTGGNSTLIEIMWFQVPWLVPAIRGPHWTCANALWSSSRVEPVGLEISTNWLVGKGKNWSPSAIPLSILQYWLWPTFPG